MVPENQQPKNQLYSQFFLKKKKTKAPIILTGAAALNKVLGRAVYDSNVQLGGKNNK